MLVREEPVAGGRGEGRCDFDEKRWDGLLSSARLAWYSHLALGHTMIASAEWSGGWRSRVPFQLMLGEEDGGVSHAMWGVG